MTKQLCSCTPRRSTTFLHIHTACIYGGHKINQYPFQTLHLWATLGITFKAMTVYRTYIVSNTPYGWDHVRLYQCNDGLGNEKWFIENFYNGGRLQELMAYQAQYYIQNSN